MTTTASQQGMGMKCDDTGIVAGTQQVLYKHWYPAAPFVGRLLPRFHLQTFAAGAAWLYCNKTKVLS